jgi:hypothetical protein
LIDRWRKKEHAQGLKPLSMFGLLWDQHLNPLCPADQTLLTHFMQHASQGFDILQCSKCGSRFPIHHDSLGNLTLSKAKLTIPQELERQVLNNMRIAN